MTCRIKSDVTNLIMNEKNKFPVTCHMKSDANNLILSDMSYDIKCDEFGFEWDVIYNPFYYEIHVMWHLI